VLNGRNGGGKVTESPFTTTPQHFPGVTHKTDHKPKLSQFSNRNLSPGPPNYEEQTRRCVSWLESADRITFSLLNEECRWCYFRSVDCRVPLILRSVGWPGSAVRIPFGQLIGQCRWYYVRTVYGGVQLILS
jgi:hypothetical protein